MRLVASLESLEEGIPNRIYHLNRKKSLLDWKDLKETYAGENLSRKFVIKKFVQS